MNIGYKLVKNAMPATAAKAPYLGMAIPVGSLAYDNILKEMIKAGTKMTQPTAKFFLDALYEYAAETIAADVVRINLGNVAIYPMIDGSFDSEDAPFDPMRNTLYVGASISQDLRDRVAGVAPDYAGDVSLGSVKLHTCMDLDGRTFKVIDGTNPFRLAGANLTVPDAEDESLALYAKDGVTKVADITVTETDGGQQITCKLDGSVGVPKGTYKVRIASHGLDPTDPLTVATLTVTLVTEIPAPKTVTYTALHGFCGDEEVTDAIHPSCPAVIIGSNLDTIESVSWTGASTETVGPEHWSVNEDGTRLTIDGETTSEMNGDAEMKVTVTVKSHGGVPSSPEQVLGKSITLMAA